MAESPDKVRRAAATVKHQLSNKLGEIWWAFMLRGLVAIAMAICVFVWPQQTVSLLVKLLGGYLIIDGLFGLAGALRTQENRFGLIPMVAGILMGIVLLFLSGISVKIFLVLVGVWLVIQGVSLAWSAVMEKPDPTIRRPLLIVGLVEALFGIIFAFWPSTGVIAISWLLSVCLLVLGGLLVFLAISIRRAKLFLNRTQASPPNRAT